MALRNVMGMTLGVSRFAMPALNGLARDLHALAAPERDENEDRGCKSSFALQQRIRERAQGPTFGAINMGFAAQMSGKDEEAQPSEQQAVTAASPLAVAAGACSSRCNPILPARSPRRSPLGGLGMARRAALPGTLLSQRRAYNAWSPAQRYFVEGDHVVAAEANRTFQFSGLDGGSYYPYVIATVIATAISTVFIVLPLVLAPSRVDLDKSSAYECGFDAFGEARQTFSVSFYLVSIMYLLFDIEIAYLFPYAMTHASIPEFWTMNLFLAILVGGFAYEWGMGALEWRE